MVYISAESIGPMPRATAAAEPGGIRSTAVVKRFSFLSPRMGAIYPLVGIMTVAFGLAGLTIGRSLTVNPDVQVDKRKRKNAPDIEQPEQMLVQSEQFMLQSPLRKLAHGHKRGIFFSDIVQQPSTPRFPREANHYKSEKPMMTIASLKL